MSNQQEQYKIPQEMLKIVAPAMDCYFFEEMNVRFKEKVEDFQFILERQLFRIFEEGYMAGYKKGFENYTAKIQATEIARQMLAEGETLQKIINYSKLSESEIETLRTE